MVSLEEGDFKSLSVASSPLAYRTFSPCLVQASVACGVPDGGIVIISVSLLVEHAPRESVATLRFQFELQNEGGSVCPTDNNAITALKWIESDRHAVSGGQNFFACPQVAYPTQSILAYTRSGIVCLQTFHSELPLGWAGTRVLELKLQPLSSSSTPYVANSGFVYYEQRNALMVCLYDGSFHMIHDVSTCPSIYPLDRSLSSEELTRRARSVFAVSEGEVSFSDANRTSGICDYDETGTVMWLHE